MKRLLILLIDAYRLLLSPFFGMQCRFYPTCSAYAREAIDTHGAIKGTWLTIRRLGKCHPWHEGGVDNVPEKHTTAIDQKKIDALVASAEENLNDSLRHFEKALSPLGKEFVHLKLQACIFIYDVCFEMAGFIRNQPKGFSRSVALKGLILRIFEYDQALNKHLIPKLLELAQARNIDIDRSAIRKLRDEWKPEFTKLQSWHEIRNQAAGHYGKDLEEQVNLLKSLSSESVMPIVNGFLNFNMGLLIILRDAGRGGKQN